MHVNVFGIVLLLLGLFLIFLGVTGKYTVFIPVSGGPGDSNTQESNAGSAVNAGINAGTQDL